jgi:predicted amidohydrolase
VVFMRVVSIGLLQMRICADPAANVAKAVRMIGLAAGKGAHMVCLPELFTTPYFPRERKRRIRPEFLESIPGKATDALSKAAREHGVAVIGGSVLEKSAGKFYNTSAIFDSGGGIIGTYRKMHIPQDEFFFEQDYFSKGNKGFQVFRVGGAKVGVLICYDQWFPEAARANALLGAEVLLYPTAIGSVQGMLQAEGSWQGAWENVMRGHAIANGVVVAATNRVGAEGRTKFWGGSFVCDAFGKTLARAGVKEQVLVQEVDLEHGKAIREGWGFFRNRRPEAYGALTRKVL